MQEPPLDAAQCLDGFMIMLIQMQQISRVLVLFALILPVSGAMGQPPQRGGDERWDQGGRGGWNQDSGRGERGNGDSESWQGRRGRGEGGRGEGGGEFDPMSFLKRLDGNGNGLIERGEMSDRTRGFLERMGLDPSQEHSLEAIANRFQAQRNGEAPEAEKGSGREIVIKVPGFGVETSSEMPPGFGDGITMVGGSPASMTQYSSSIQEMVQQTLARYDENKNGVIDGEEFERVRWRSPSAQEADSNGDTVLTINEIADRYAAREQASNQDSSQGGREGANRDESESNQDERRSRGFRSRGEESNNREASSDRSGGPLASETPNTPSSSDEMRRIREYAQALMKNYDKDGDGKLNQDEVAQMRRKPSDLDSDGFVSIEEYIEFVQTGTSRTSSASSEGQPPAATASRDERNSERQSSGRSYSGRQRSGSSGDSGPTGGGRESSQTQFSFFERDASGDNQVQMHEFSAEWNDETLRQFRFYDLNNDGVITYQEFETARKSG